MRSWSALLTFPTVDERSLREAHWLHDKGAWDLLIGVGKVFWGVTESRHLVDIVNQTDLVENPDQEEYRSIIWHSRFSFLVPMIVSLCLCLVTAILHRAPLSITSPTLI